jgi:hypothetical protein
MRQASLGFEPVKLGGSLGTARLRGRAVRLAALPFRSAWRKAIFVIRQQAALLLDLDIQLV